MPSSLSHDEQHQLDLAYRWCCHLTRTRARNFYYAIRMLPGPRYRAMCAVYAFFRDCDDLSDAPEIANRRQSLEQWRRLLYGAPSTRRFPGLPAFHDATNRYDIPLEYYSELIDGTVSDLDVMRLDTYDQLYKYCYQVASTVGLVCIHIFGYDKSPEAEKMAEYQGVAFQLTNILRDIAEDAERGRVYIPADILGQFGLTSDDVIKGCQPERLDDLVTFLANKAEEYYQMSAALGGHINPVSRPALACMTSIYHGILQQVKQLKGQVINTRARLTTCRKLLIVGQAYVKSWIENAKQFFIDYFMCRS